MSPSTYYRAPSQEQLKLLGELASGTQTRDDAVLSRSPDWLILERSAKIPVGTAEVLTSMNGMKPSDKADVVRKNRNISLYLIPLLGTEADTAVVQFILTLLYEIVRNDTAVVDSMNASLIGVDAFDPLYSLLMNHSVDSFTADKACFLLTSLISRAPRSTYTDDQVQQLINLIVMGGECAITAPGRLDGLKNLMKLDHYRTLVWSTQGASTMIVSNLDASKKSTVYTALFCSWLITFNEKLLTPFTQTGAVVKICNILKESKTEKVVRTCIHTLLNCLPNDESVEAVIQQNAVHTLTLLEYEKWRDEELYNEIRDGLTALQHKIKLLSNFDRYCRELDSGKLTWSYLHSERFWHENVNHFEDNEFCSVKKLVLLLRSPDPTTLSVACFDLGEFSRLYPTGKKVIQKLKAKELVMMLMSHKDREVTRESLLCVQKMMLDNWKTAAMAR